MNMLKSFDSERSIGIIDILRELPFEIDTPLHRRRAHNFEKGNFPSSAVAHDGCVLLSPRGMTSCPVEGHVAFATGLLISERPLKPLTLAVGSPEGLSAQKTYTSSAKPGTTVFEAARGW